MVERGPELAQGLARWIHLLLGTCGQICIELYTSPALHGRDCGARAKAILSSRLVPLRGLMRRPPFESMPDFVTDESIFDNSVTRYGAGEARVPGAISSVA